jgi:hypothetical protein
MVGLILLGLMVGALPTKAEEGESVGLFTKKQEVTLDAFCRDFYDRNIMNPVLEGIDIVAGFVEVIKKNLVEVDQKLSSIDDKELAAEVILLRFEIFGLAWIHQFGDRLAVAQSVFTKNYLHENGRDDIWDNMEFYNQAIARSSTLKASNPKNPEYAFLTKVNKTRMDLFTKFHNEGHDPVAIARALNRLFTEDAWKSDNTRQLLMFGLYDHLGFGPNCDESKWANEEAQFRLKGVIFGLYKGALEATEEIKIVNK